MLNFQAPYDRETYLKWLHNEFLPEDFAAGSEKIPFAFKAKYIRHVFYLGRSESLQLPVYEIHHQAAGDPRIGLARETFHIMAEYLAGNALVLFVSATSPNYRLSYVSMDFKIDAGKVKKEFSNPRRFSFFLGPGCKTHTPIEFLQKKGRIKSLADLQERFSVEVVNKEFYNEIARLFTFLVGGSRRLGNQTIDEKGVLKLPDLPNLGANHTKFQEFSVRLIGRLVFCWFLKKKSSPAGIPLISDELLSSQAVHENEHYYHNILEYLFFQVLNTPQKERNDLVRERFKDTPFLNGGLFEPHEDDFYEPDKIMGITRYLNTLIIPDVWFQELFKVFETYNFTIDENTTIDIELSIDPEMLGRIFENLLAEIDPDTGETARKSTGSFYTPRPIVEYMVDESLKHYLQRKTGAGAAVLDALLNYSEDVQLSDKDKAKFVKALDEIKVLDPACGSGAFPMGVLQKMLLILQKVDPRAEETRRRLLDNIADPTLRAMIDKKISGGHELWDYTRKLNIIRKSIYGIDKQPISVEISKLRFFLSLIVEEKVQDREDNRGIHALPNLEFKFVSADTLIGLHQEEDVKNSQASMFEDDFFDHFEKQVAVYFSASTPKEKSHLRKTIISLVEKKVNEKFALIQQLGEFTTDVKKKHIRQLQIGIQTSWLAKWESYKNLFHNQTVQFFDLRYFFPECQNGFDVVIGNPPYIQLQKEGGKLAGLYENENYASFERTGDIYCLFYERGRQFLNETGCLCYITSNKWMRAGYGQSLRTFFIDQTQPRILLDFGDSQIFANATTYTNILLFDKNRQDGFKPTTLDLSRESIDHKPLLHMVQEKQNEYVSEFTAERFLIVREAEIRIKRKVEAQGIPLRDWDVQINYGIKTGLNEAFIIDAATRAKLIEKDKKSADIIKPILRGKDIKRYRIEYADLWLIFLPWHFPLHDDQSIQGASEEAEKKFKLQYPAIYKHMLQHKDALLNRNQDETGIRYEWYALQRCAASYLEEFEKDKIVWLEISQEGDFYLDENKYYLPNTAYMLTGPFLKYLLANLNSSLHSYYFRMLTDEISGKSRRYTKQYVERICIKKVSQAQATPFGKIVDSIQTARKAGKKTTELERRLDLMIYKLYELSYDEARIIDPELGSRLSRAEYTI